MADDTTADQAALTSYDAAAPLDPAALQQWMRSMALLQSMTRHHPEIDTDTLRLARALSGTHLLMMAMVDDYLRPYGLSWSKLFILLWLRAAGDAGMDGLAPSVLSTYLTLTRNTVSTLLGGLERQGHITRALDADDKRRFIIRLTPTGAALLQTCVVPLFRQFQTIISQMERTRRCDLLVGLAQLQQLLHDNPIADSLAE